MAVRKGCVVIVVDRSIRDAYKLRAAQLKVSMQGLIEAALKTYAETWKKPGRKTK